MTIETAHIWKCKDSDRQYKLYLDEKDNHIYPEVVETVEREYATLMGANDHEHRFTNIISLSNQVLHICRGKAAND